MLSFPSKSMQQIVLLLRSRVSELLMGIFLSLHMQSNILGPDPCTCVVHCTLYYLMLRSQTRKVRADCTKGYIYKKNLIIKPVNPLQINCQITEEDFSFFCVIYVADYVKEANPSFCVLFTWYKCFFCRQINEFHN